MSDRPRDDARSLVGRLYDTYGAALYRYALILLADTAAAEDAVHQVFAAILRHPPRFEEELHYLRRAVRNECYSALRRQQRDGQHPAAAAILEPVVEAAAHDERIAVERALRDLPPEQREVIALHVFEGLTFQEIADAGGLSINTVTARYRYALGKLRQILTTSWKGRRSGG
jgi:RNA polymerase sigma-70 factor (ECF subfamily)